MYTAFCQCIMYMQLEHHQGVHMGSFAPNPCAYIYMHPSNALCSSVVYPSSLSQYACFTTLSQPTCHA